MKILLIILLTFIGITSAVSGLLMIAKPGGDFFQMPVSLLKDSPFNNFLIPGIILTIAVGVTNLLASIYNWQHRKGCYNWAMAGGLMICGWIVTQMILIHQVSWLQFLYLGVGSFTILLAYQLKGKWAV